MPRRAPRSARTAQRLSAVALESGMKGFVWGALGLALTGTLAGTASARAADLSYGSRGPYTVNQPLNAYSWAGPYLGGNLGYGWGAGQNKTAQPPGFAGGVS